LVFVTPTAPTELSTVRSAEVMISCHDIAAALEFYVELLGFRVASIFPADAPTVAVLHGYGLRLRLDPAATAPGSLRLQCDDADVLGPDRRLVAPDGTVIEIVPANPPMVLPPVQQSFVLERASDEASWSVGRAGMRYRDLIPGRQGDRFIASHIHIPNAGPVPDYVHFHDVRFQMIFCYRGWTRLVYEDQGEPFILNAGDCVLQPPHIRHRVLESSANLEVIELGCPALHETHADPKMSLPTATLNQDRLFGGQRFVRHQANHASWEPYSHGFERCRFGLREATSGLAEASVLRPSASANPLSHGGEFFFHFVLQGSVTLERGGHASNNLRAGDSYVMPAGETFALNRRSDDLEILEVTLPG
jgi:mannose-6-phosphate isomerase-like protein (cupin superfamily)